jgi:hypothetical protein
MTGRSTEEDRVPTGGASPKRVTSSVPRVPIELVCVEIHDHQTQVSITAHDLTKHVRSDIEIGSIIVVVSDGS